VVSSSSICRSPSMTLLGEGVMARFERLDRLVNRLLDGGRQRHGIALQVRQIALQVFGH